MAQAGVEGNRSNKIIDIIVPFRPYLSFRKKGVEIPYGKTRQTSQARSPIEATLVSSRMIE